MARILKSENFKFEFENNVMNDVDSFKDVKHHYVKFQQNRFSCSVLVERIF